MQSAVQNAVQNGIENLSGSSVIMNAHPGDGYRFQARSKDELIATQHLVPGTPKPEDLPEQEPEPGVSAPRRVAKPTPPPMGVPNVQGGGWLL